MIADLLKDTVHKDVQIRKLSTALNPELKITSEYVTTYGLALIASDLLLIKKDPLVRILRYVLYQYE